MEKQCGKFPKCGGNPQEKMYNRNSTIEAQYKKYWNKGEKMTKRIRDYGIIIGDMKTGRLNKITDVPGVTVGHATVDTKEHKTGVTVILPCTDNPFIRKLTAAAYIHNGFGKSQGLVQVEELGTLETPIALTNTLNVGRVHDAVVDYMIERCAGDGVEVTSINPVVGECNDATLNHIRERVVGKTEVDRAIASACEDFEEGGVGAGTGTICFGCKGGIGSASRVMGYDDREYTLGVLVQSNFGRTKDLRLDGRKIGPEVAELIEEAKLDKGSIMMIVATDLPVSDRQLKRIIRRAGAGLSRCGSYMGHGSGDIVIGFTTANRVSTGEGADVLDMKILREDRLEQAFRAASDATEEAILNSLAAGRTVTGYRSHTCYGLTELFLRNV